MSELMDEAVIRMPFDMAMEIELSRKQFYDRANALLSELTELRAKMAEIESQEPVFYSVHRKENEPSNAVCFDDIEAANKYVNTNYNLCVSGLYAKPAPADKPARIADEMISRAMGVVIGYSGEYGTHNEYLSKDSAREVLEAALSVSEQVPEVAVPDTLCEQLEIVSRRLDKDGLFAMRETVNSAIAILSAPSHSQQNSDVEGFKLIPDLPHGFNHSAYNRHTGEWVYLNHANTWQMFQGPIAAAPSHSQQSAKRVTEQDAYAIVTSILQFQEDYRAFDFDIWLDGEDRTGRDLLAKLNDRCPSHDSEQRE